MFSQRTFCGVYVGWAATSFRGALSIDGLGNGLYIEPTVFTGTNNMRVFQEEMFGPVLSVTAFKDFDDAIAIANDTIYGLGAGRWSRNGNTATGFARTGTTPAVSTICRYHCAGDSGKREWIHHRGRVPEQGGSGAAPASGTALVSPENWFHLL